MIAHGLVRAMHEKDRLRCLAGPAACAEVTAALEAIGLDVALGTGPRRCRAGPVASATVTAA